MRRTYPKSGRVYTLTYIFNSLELRDTPSLCFSYEGRECGIQNSHILNEELLAIPGMADSKWEYQYETHEWVPIFKFAEGQDAKIEDLVDMEPWYDDIVCDIVDSLWVTPKGHHREQFGVREALNSGIFTLPPDVTLWLDPDWHKKHCSKCERWLTPYGTELTGSIRESINFKNDGVCAMCHAEAGDEEAIEIQKGSRYSTNKFGKYYYKNFQTKS